MFNQEADPVTWLVYDAAIHTVDWAMRPVVDRTLRHQVQRVIKAAGMPLHDQLDQEMAGPNAPARLGIIGVLQAMTVKMPLAGDVGS